MYWTWILLIPISLSALSGCASTTVRQYDVEPFGPISNVHERKDLGIRFYENAPHILVYRADKEGGGEVYKAEVIWLPDTSTVYTAHPENLLGINNTTLTFEKGVLKESSVLTDSTAIPKALITQALGLAKARLEALDKPHSEELVAILYRIGQGENGRPRLLRQEVGYSLPPSQ